MPPRPTRPTAFAETLGIILTLHSFSIVYVSSVQAEVTATASPAASRTYTDATLLGELDALYTGAVRRARLAASKAQAEALRALGLRLVEQNEHAQQTSRALAKRLHLKIHSAPSASTRGSGLIDSEVLQSVSGREFDRLYLEQALQAHQVDVATLKERLLPRAGNKEIKTHLEAVAVPALTQQTADMIHLGRQLKISAANGCILPAVPGTNNNPTDGHR